MKFINSSGISNVFDNLMQNYAKYKWAVAWAGADFDKISMLENNSNKIQRLIIGIHFYQTHPTFIEKFYQHQNVKFIFKPSGIFHPKIYLFENEPNDWAVIIGSHNFTNSAFSSNSEASVLITSNDTIDKQFKVDIDNYISALWNQSERIDHEKLEDYKNIYKKQAVHLTNLTIKTRTNSKKDKLLLEVEKMYWDEYYSEIKKHEHIPRLKLLTTASNLFHKYNKFSNVSELERKGIAGFYNNDYNIDGYNWFAFGSMKGAGYFKSEIIKNNPYISEALDFIPLEGIVTKTDYNKFVTKFNKAIPNFKNPTATATRLLSMKRPDYFFCFNSKNRKGLAKAFEIKENLNLKEYWDLVLEKIFSSYWWNDTTLKTGIELESFNFRAAFIDNLYFEAF